MDLPDPRHSRASVPYAAAGREFARIDPRQDCDTPAPRRRPQRILYLDHTGAMGGGEVALVNLVQNLDRSRYQPVVALFEDGPLAVRLREAEIETHLVPLPESLIQTRKESLSGLGLLRGGDLFRLLAHVRRLARFIRQGHFDLVHTNSLKSDIIGALAARLAGTPVLWHVRDRIHRDYLPRQAVIAFRAACCLLPASCYPRASCASSRFWSCPSPSRPRRLPPFLTSSTTSCNEIFPF